MSEGLYPHPPEVPEFVDFDMGVELHERLRLTLQNMRNLNHRLALMETNLRDLERLVRSMNGMIYGP